MRAAGIRHLRADIEVLSLPEPCALRADEVLDHANPRWPDVASDGARLRRLVDLLGRGELTVFIDSSYPWERAAQALERVERGTHGRAVAITPA